MSSRQKNIFLFILIWILASILGLNLRLYTFRNNIPHEVEEKATLVVIKNLRKTINDQINKTSPSSLSPMEKQKIAKEQFDQILHNENKKVRAAIEQVSRQISKTLPDEQKPVYLLASDSYYYYNLTENIVATGKISNKIHGSKYFNALMNAPHGYWEPLRLYPYVGNAVYKIVSRFKPNMPLMEGVAYTPLFLTVLIILIFLLGCRILDCNLGTSFIGVIYFLCAPIFLRRSMFGWYDDDPPNVFFLLTILTVFFYGLKNLKRRRTLILCAVGCGILFTLYALFWQGWVFLASIIAAALISMMIYNHFILKKLTETRTLLIYSSVVLTSTFAGIALVFGPQDIITLFKEGWDALQDFINPQLSLWPDLYIAVGELLAPSKAEWLKMMGGLLFIIVAVIGLLYRGINLFRKPENTNNFSSILLILFTAAGIKLSLDAQRFEILCLIPLALTFPIGLQFFWDNFKKFTLIKVPVIGQTAISLVLVFLLCLIQLRDAKNITPDILNKIFNSTWDAALTKIKNETPKDSIVNTWWPPGHFIKGIAQRRVTFDGATINKPQSYWIANALLTTDEKVSVGILRMLNTSGNDAADYLIEEGLSLSQAVDLIKSIVNVDETRARQILIPHLKKQQINHLLSLTHGHPPPSYLLIYNDMATDSLQFNFVGDWDFKKIEAIDKDPVSKKNIPKRGSKDYVSFLWKLAGGVPRYTPLFIPVLEKERAMMFENNILIDRDSMNCSINSPKYGKGIPKSIFYQQNGDFIEKKFADGKLPISVILVDDHTGPKCMLADASLARSILLRLYYFGGKGLNLFEPFTDEQDSTGRTRIVIYKINWDQL